MQMSPVALAMEVGGSWPPNHGPAEGLLSVLREIQAG